MRLSTAFLAGLTFPFPFQREKHKRLFRRTSEHLQWLLAKFSYFLFVSTVILRPPGCDTVTRGAVMLLILDSVNQGCNLRQQSPPIIPQE
ncbi:hypothetical protein RRG08_063473 [Elysia crispata]|uniref:Uncharacterized protein n=1 Tax=Elysia crispata TaxID=231223 RepID=A0AAE1DV20_9GAST|nr:hypothetical protein RRG08_063473 [Elysia crispata]